jgi:rSAM/selenodomain-associated transferase 2
MTLSIIVPTYNEAHNTSRIIDDSLRVQAQWIIVDGGSSDDTVSNLRNAGLYVLTSSKGRAVQMNAGARTAVGEWLIFLHADTILPDAAIEYFHAHVARHPETPGGAFSLRMENPKWKYRYLEFYVKWRCRLLKLPFGDQAMFVRKSLFDKLGGFNESLPVMEDIEFVRKLNRCPGFITLPAPVITSARRYEQEGFFIRSAKNLVMQILYKFGFPASKLRAMYR